MKCEEGIEHNEFFVVKLENFSPNVVVIGYYGVIEQQFNREQVVAMQEDIFNISKIQRQIRVL